MKPTLRLCDFRHILSEDVQADSVRISGILPGDDRIIEATFIRQPGPRGSWTTEDWFRRDKEKQ